MVDSRPVYAHIASRLTTYLGNSIYSKLIEHTRCAPQPNAYRFKENGGKKCCEFSSPRMNRIGLNARSGGTPKNVSQSRVGKTKSAIADKLCVGALPPITLWWHTKRCNGGNQIDLQLAQVCGAHISNRPRPSPVGSISALLVYVCKVKARARLRSSWRYLLPSCSNQRRRPWGDQTEI